MSISFNKETKTFYLESKDVSYVMCVNEFGYLQHQYFGKRIGKDELSHTLRLQDRGQESSLPDATKRYHTLNQYLLECPTFGKGDYRESMLALNDSIGSRMSDYKYVSHKIVNKKPAIDGMPSLRDGKTLIITLFDAFNGSELKLYYSVYEDVPVIARRAEITNKSKKSLMIDRAYSACLDLYDNKWEAISLYGAHLRERFIDRTPLHHGTFAIDSKRGSSSAQLNPFLALVRKTTTEDYGEAIGVNLVYSGNFAIKAQVNQIDNTRLLVGINDYDFEWELRKGEKFSTPEAVFVYSDAGLGKMSRAFHDLYRDHLINPNFVKAPRPIVINNWEATYFNFDEKKLCAIVDSVKGTGIDTLVVDDGWFGKRDDDTTSLGDWFINEPKLPRGLTPIIDYAHANGMKFGLWFEPEMISEDSELYRAHPDWLIHVPGLKPCTGRVQHILDLSRKEVCDYIISVVSNILKTHEIDYVKWDYNRTFTENYSVALKNRSKEIYHRYMLGLYRVCEELVNGHPNIFFEGCASGGCRFDPAMAYYFPQIWTSDDTDAQMRTLVQYGTSMCYPLSLMSCHVSVCPNHQTGRTTAFKSRADIAHLGATGYELDTTKLSCDELAQIKEQVEDYKKMEDLVLNGDFYRLNSPFDENLFAVQIVSKDKARSHITTMRTLVLANSPVNKIYPKGLDEKTLYCVKELGKNLLGSTIMNCGLLCKYDYKTADFATLTFTNEKV